MVKSKWAQDQENRINLAAYGSKAVRVVLISESWDGKRKLVVKHVAPNRAAAKEWERDFQARCNRFNIDSSWHKILGVRQFAKLEKEIQAEVSARRAKGAVKAAATRKKAGPNNFIRCPSCRAKSKKLFSEMGGLQTRRCQNGHSFEVDTFGGVVRGFQLVERTDRPTYVGPNMSYNDYIYGKFAKR